MLVLTYSYGLIIEKFLDGLIVLIINKKFNALISIVILFLIDIFLDYPLIVSAIF